MFAWKHVLHHHHPAGRIHHGICAGQAIHRLRSRLDRIAAALLPAHGR
jgi:hypothetical protein